MDMKMYKEVMAIKKECRDMDIPIEFTDKDKVITSSTIDFPEKRSLNFDRHVTWKMLVCDNMDLNDDYEV